MARIFNQEPVSFRQPRDCKEIRYLDRPRRVGKKMSRLYAGSSHHVRYDMISFLRRLWAFARPYQSRFFLGLGFGMLYALTNGALVVVIRLVVNLVFPGPGTEQLSVADHLEKLPGFVRPIVESASQWLPILHSPASKAGQALVIA